MTLMVFSAPEKNNMNSAYFHPPIFHQTKYWIRSAEKKVNKIKAAFHFYLDFGSKTK